MDRYGVAQSIKNPDNDASPEDADLETTEEEEDD